MFAPHVQRQRVRYPDWPCIEARSTNGPQTFAILSPVPGAPSLDSAPFFQASGGCTHSGETRDVVLSFAGAGLLGCAQGRTTHTEGAEKIAPSVSGCCGGHNAGAPFSRVPTHAAQKTLVAAHGSLTGRAPAMLSLRCMRCRRGGVSQRPRAQPSAWNTRTSHRCAHSSVGANLCKRPVVRQACQESAALFERRCASAGCGAPLSWKAAP